MYIGLHVKYRCSWPILMKLEFYRQILSNIMKIRLVGAELFHADRRTDKQEDGRVGGQAGRQRYEAKSSFRYNDTHIGTRYVILAKHWMWLPDDGFI